MRKNLYRMRKEGIILKEVQSSSKIKPPADLNVNHEREMR